MAKRTNPAPPEAPRVLEPVRTPEDAVVDRTLRPKTFADYVGQARHTENLRVFVQAARQRREPLDHVLLCGPPGLGKTTLAHILANEMGVQVHSTSGPVIEHKGALAALLTTKVQPGDILFIDEIHRLSPAVEESLYPAMDELVIDVATGDGPFANAIQIPIQPFTLVGATTRTGLLTAPLFSRFGHVVRLDFYTVADLAKIIERSAALLRLPLHGAAAMEVALRSRGTPRIANRLLRRVRDFAQVYGNGTIDPAQVVTASERLEIDASGLDEMDRRYLSVIVDHYDGGPVGIDTLAAALSEPRDTLEDVYEPYLLQQGYVGRTPRGRVATRKGYAAIARKVPAKVAAETNQEALFDELDPSGGALD